MNAITVGGREMFAKGIAETIYTERETGNIVGYDRVATEDAFTTETNFQEVSGGFGNAIVGILPDSTRITGTHTSQAFSLETRRLISGGKLAYNAVSPVCETLSSVESTSLEVTGNPVKHLGQPASDTLCWCYVREHGAKEFVGTNYGLNPATKTVANFVAEIGKSYDVLYFVNNASARSLELPEVFNPKLLTLQVKYGMYAMQNNSVSNGTFVGWMYFVVPKIQLTGNAGMSAEQTSNATTDGAWMAISDENTPMSCDECGSSGRTSAYYIFVPCGEATQEVEDLAVIGGTLSIPVSASKRMPVKYVMPDGSIVQPNFTDLTYTKTGNVTVSSDGYITAGNTAGDASVTATLTKADGTVLTAVCTVLITSAS